MPLRLHAKQALKSPQALQLLPLLRPRQVSSGTLLLQCWAHALQLTLPLPQQAQSCPVTRQVPCWTLRETHSHRV